MRVLITGGAGYIGSVLTKTLLPKHEVTVLDIQRYGRENLLHLCDQENLTFIKGDVLNHDTLDLLLDEADAIIPLAAYVGAEICDANYDDATRVNKETIEYIASRKKPEQKLIYPNTNSGYGTQTGEFYCTEETPLEPITHYGRTKAAGEKAVMTTDSITLRLATVFGCSPRMRLDLLVNDFVRRAYFNRGVDIFEPHFMRNYVHIQDVADCFAYCLDNYDSMKGEVYNLGNDSINMSKLDMALKVKERIPSFRITTDDTREDPDKRNYIVSSKKLWGKGFMASRGLDLGITQLMKAYSMLGDKDCNYL